MDRVLDVSNDHGTIFYIHNASSFWPIVAISSLPDAIGVSSLFDVGESEEVGWCLEILAELESDWW